MDLNRANIIPLRKNGEMDFIARLLATMAGLWVTTRVVSSISIESSSPSQTVIVLAAVALVFTAVNSIIKPIVTTLITSVVSSIVSGILRDKKDKRD